VTGTATDRPLKVGIQLPEVERVVRWPELLAMARLAESIGLDSLWSGDHLLYRDADGAASGPWEVWSVLAALAAVTERVEIGPLVASAGFHSPAMLAKKAAAVDEISGGRLIVGLGSGWNEPDYSAFGFHYDRRVARFEESFDIIRRLLAGETVDHDTEFYRLRGSVLLPASARPGGPPLMIGSIGERMLRITLPYVQLWNIWFDAWKNDPRELPRLLEWLDRQCEQVGRDPRTLGKTVAVLVRLTGGRGRRNSTDEFPALTGGPEAIADGLRAIAATGISHVQLVLDPITSGAIGELAPVLESLDQA
jgi:alkanesulfonate monooxygenase SsuD/methylene tetrahydromethanopterin reductase-like flavin-dependent oxidoreductase (luciferase family)